MLKHASNSGGPITGQLRTSNASSTRKLQSKLPQPLNITPLNNVILQNGSATATSNAINGGSRIATLLNISPDAQQTNNNAGTLLAQTVTTASSTTPNVVMRNSLPPTLPTLLGNVGNSDGSNNAKTTTTTSVTPIITHLTSNGLNNNNIGNNLYTNQHIALAHATVATAASDNGTNANSARLNLHNNVGNASTNHPQHHSVDGNLHNYTKCTNPGTVLINQSKHGPGPREALTSLGLLCLVSLLLALLSLIFLLKISPNAREDALSRSSPEDFLIVYDVTLALSALSLSLNLCCLLVCAIQFLFAVKLVRSPMFNGRDNRYLEKSSISRTCAVGGFFISIPVFLTGIILYTFNHFHSTPAIISSILIGIGIVFCGAAMVHNVFIWQKEKTISYRSPSMHQQPHQQQLQQQQKQHLRHTVPSHHTSLLSQIGPITTPLTYLNQSQAPVQGQRPGLAPSSSLPPHLNFNHSVNTSILVQPTPVTPVSPNHSHGSSNPLANFSSSFLIRAATATPPTPKPITNVYLNAAGMTNFNGNTNGSGNGTGNCNSNMDNDNSGTGGTNGIIGRETNGSVSPSLPTTTMDIKNVTNNSLHELSTLV